MKRTRKILISAILTMSFITSTFALETLPIPENLIAFDSTEGKTVFARSSNNAFWKLMPYFTTEDGLTFCAVASGVMVLNALNIQPPITPSHAPYRIFEQDNFFTDSVLKIITPAEINMHGMTLEQLGESIQAQGVKAGITYGSDITEKDFRKTLIAAIRSDDQYIIVNFHRKYLNEVGEGHFSPLAAYDEKTDRFLLLDVARYKYSVVWVKTEDLYKAIRLNTKGKVEKIRGYLIINSI